MIIMEKLTEEEMKEYRYMYTYASLYDKCCDAYDNITKSYPNFRNEIDKLHSTQIFKENYPNATDKEITAHAYALNIMVCLMFG